MTSCLGYRLGQGPFDSKGKTISISCVAGDIHGAFITALVHEIKSRTQLTVVRSGGDYQLLVTLAKPCEENNNYRYTRHHRGRVTHIVAPIEARLSLTACCELMDQIECCSLMGKKEITAYLDFDYESDFAKSNSQDFSLAQLEMHDLAKDQALWRLDQRLAQKVVDVLISCW